MNEAQESLSNRRSDDRVRCFQRTQYIDARGIRQRTEILNTSSGGARLTTDLGVKSGDLLRIFHVAHNGNVGDVHAEVRWVSPLPGGTRLLVGVKRIQY